MTVTDSLAVLRTRLANERTLLSYARTALALLAGGISLLHFLQSRGWHAAGWTLILIGLCLGAIGWRRFHQVRRTLESL